MSGNGAPRQIWMDQDGGWEDVAALAILLRSPDIKVLGIAITPGIADGTTALGRTRMLLDELKERDAKILDDIPAGADILATGPLTRIARLIETGRAPAKLTWMGGAIHSPGNAKNNAEWNAAADSRALRIVLESKVPLTICPLDLTDRFPANARVIAPDSTGVAAELRKAYAEPKRCWWDELAAASLAAPGIFKGADMELIWAKGGRTVAQKGGKKTRVLGACDPAAFEALLRGSLRY